MKSTSFLILTQYYPPEVGAAQTRLMALTENLVAQGHRVEVVTSVPNYPDGIIQKEFQGRFYVHRKLGTTSIHHFWAYPSSGKGLGRLFNYLSFAITALGALFVARRPDIIFVNSGPLFIALPGRFLSSLWSVPYVFNVSDLWPRSVEHVQGLGAHLFVKFALQLEKWAYSGAWKVNAITEGVQEILLRDKKIPPEKLLFLPNGVDTDLFSPRRASHKAQKSITRAQLQLGNEFVYIYPGNHGYAHALETVVEAADLLKESSIRVLLVGGGSEKPRLQELAQKKNLKNIIFAGPVSPEDLVDYIALADAGLIHIRNTPLAQETRPAKMFPLMAMEKPILYAGFGEGADLLSQHQGGVVIAPENPSQLAAELLKMAQQGSENRQRGLRNREFVETRMSISKIIEHWLQDLHRSM